MIVIIDYGMGNVGSIYNMFNRLGAKSTISGDPLAIEKAEKLVLPGVGAFDTGMRNLRDHGLVPLLEKRVLQDKAPILGICLGMQLFSQRSEEGNLAGLGWIDSETIRFRFEATSSALKVPHMGWNYVIPKKDSRLFDAMYDQPRFYFVHSYYVRCRNQEDEWLCCEYGLKFAAAVQRSNIIGVQFHPEKSHKFGMRLLGNFAQMR